MRRISTNEFFTESRNSLLLDVRSPGEHNHAHIPGAVNLPLFTDEERKVVGTAYKKQSREMAIKIGLDYFGPRMRSMVEEVEELISKRQQAIDTNANRPLPTARSVFIYCWRGGMRSGAIAWLLNLYGFDVTVLAGGYKAFRNQVLRSFEEPYCLKILGGYTGSGKTALLQQLKNQGQTVVDLERLASHKGSAFGHLGMPAQPSQEMFENLLSGELKKMSGDWPAVNDKAEDTTTNPKRQTANRFVWLEDESQRIGHVNLPKAFWETMRHSPLVFLEIPFEERLNRLVGEYGGLDNDQMIAAVQRITKSLGGLDAKTTVQLLHEGKTKEAFAILLRYYDRQYQKNLHSRPAESTITHLFLTGSTEEITAELLSNQTTPQTWINP